MAPLVDTHVHLTDRRYAVDLEQVMQRARAAGVVRLVVVGYDLASSEASISLAARYPDVWAAVGIHPHNARDASESALSRLDELSKAQRVVAVGEFGLDFYR
ncbi:MAG TPA: TatD family hydrolase, partial [Chloroflexota bacterium]|nr:TatD family hydrolase [Chloroflexota bacterium]